ncbi:nucleotide exchange factor GrpE [Salininema proteolyticum]|uniref:Protein GrpE n=1 Tax=Salininema proteolyticum TaxID=1607685 RepID=A0ABV8TTU3_9ACTN
MSDENKGEEPREEAAAGEPDNGSEEAAPEGAENAETDRGSSAEGDDAPEEGEALTVDDILAAAEEDGAAMEESFKVLEKSLSERTADLQRVTAEYQNYRKRVERDKSRAAELAVGNLVSALLPVLDDLDRAREHGDLTGPFAAVADSLASALEKQGLEAFGEKGDSFDPAIHEAVAHLQDPSVDGPTCIDVMRRGYRIGERLVRPAMVAVADAPEEAGSEDGPAEPKGSEGGDDPKNEE